MNDKKWRNASISHPDTHQWCFVYTNCVDLVMPIRIAFYVADIIYPRSKKGSWIHYESANDITDEVDAWMPMFLDPPEWCNNESNSCV